MKLKKITFLFLFFGVLGYAQQYKYRVQIENYVYTMRAKSGLCGPNKHVRLWVVFDDNTQQMLYTTGNPSNLNRPNFIDRYVLKKPKSVHFSSFVHEEDAVGFCNGHTASVRINRNLTFNSSSVASGFLTDSDSNGGGDASINVRFNYRVEPVVKAYSYKVEYDIDLSNKLFNSKQYGGNYDLRVRTENVNGSESKQIYRDVVPHTRENDPLILRNKKYDSIIRFRIPLEKMVGSRDIYYESQLLCATDAGDPGGGGIGGVNTIDSSTDVRISDPSGCKIGSQIFPHCSSAIVNSFSMYRIYDKLSQIPKNIPNFGSGSPELKVCEPFKVYVNDCNQSSSYAVQYAIGSGTFKTYLPYAKRGDSFDLDYTRLPGASPTQSVKIKIKYYNVDCDSYPYLCSDVTVFNVFQCSPQLADKDPTPVKTTCVGGTNGGFKIRLGRDLKSDGSENLIVSLYEEDNTAIGGYGFRLQQDINTLTDNGDGTYTFEWNRITDGLLPNKSYQVRYQTLIGGNAINGTDPSWATAETTNPFTIGEPTPLDYEVIHLTDKECAQANVKDGSTEIKIKSNQSGRTFQYIIHTVVGSGSSATLTLYKNWTSFSSSSIIINNLPKNKYRIQVRDSQSCYAR